MKHRALAGPSESSASISRPPPHRRTGAVAEAPPGVQYRQSPPSPTEAFGSKPQRKANLFPIAVASGTVLGALVGRMGTERWQPASVGASETRVGLTMTSRRAGIGLVVSGSW